MVCIYIITENSTSSWTLIYSVLLTTMLAPLLCRLDMKRNTIWWYKMEWLYLILYFLNQRMMRAVV